MRPRPDEQASSRRCCSLFYFGCLPNGFNEGNRSLRCVSSQPRAGRRNWRPGELLTTQQRYQGNRRFARSEKKYTHMQMLLRHTEPLTFNPKPVVSASSLKLGGPSHSSEEVMRVGLCVPCGREAHHLDQIDKDSQQLERFDSRPPRQGRIDRCRTSGGEGHRPCNRMGTRPSCSLSSHICLKSCRTT